MKLISLFRNKTAKNAWFLVLGKTIQMAFGLVIGMLTARYLGPSNYGLINYAAAYTAFFASVCTLGINDVIVKELIDHPDQEGMVLGTGLGLRAVSSFLSAVVIVAVSCVVDRGEKTTIIVVALSSIGMLFQVVELISYWFQSRLESKITAIATLIAYLISSAYKVSLLIRQKPVAYFALVSSIDYLCLGVIQYIQYRKRGGKRLSFSKEYGKELLSRSKHFILPSLMVSIYGQTDKLMLKPLMGETEVGYYSTAVVLSGIWCFVLTAIIQSAYPSIMEASKDKEDALFRRRNMLLYAVVFYLSVLVSLIFTVFPGFIIKTLYGETYLPAVNPLRIITWYTAFSYLGVARNAWIVAKDRQKHLFKIYAASAIANVILNILLIPRWGASGAAVASLTAQVFSTFVVPFFIPDLKENAQMMLDAIALKGIIRSKEETPMHRQ